MPSTIITKKELEKEAKQFYTKTYLEKDLKFQTGERKNFEKKGKKFIYNLELIEKKDSLHYRRSGLNQILCKLAKEKEKIIFFNLNLLKQEKYPEIIIGRMKFNIKLCRKYKVVMKAGFICNNKIEIKNPEDVKSLLITLGMTQKEAKEALEF